MSGAATRPDHFATGGRSWNKLGYPLRPSPDDTALLQRLIASHAKPDLQVMVLGLTVEIIGCDYPPGTRLVAVDHSPEMIARLWPAPKAPPNAEVMRADWCSMPVPDQSFDLVLGDGCFALLRQPEGYDQALREFSRVLRPDGRFAIRIFTRPEQRESVDAIGAALARGEIGSVNALKLRLWAAVRSAEGVLLDDVWHAWNSIRDHLTPSEQRGGFTAWEVSGIENYRGQQTRYALPTIAEFREHARASFREEHCFPGTGELGPLCPTFVFAPR